MPTLLVPAHRDVPARAHPAPGRDRRATGAARTTRSGCRSSARVIALWHLYIEANPEAESPSCRIGAPCSTKWIDEFGYVTIPMLALTAFAAIATLLVLALRPATPRISFAYGHAPARCLLRGRRAAQLLAGGGAAGRLAAGRQPADPVARAAARSPAARPLRTPRRADRGRARALSRRAAAAGARGAAARAARLGGGRDGAGSPRARRLVRARARPSCRCCSASSGSGTPRCASCSPSPTRRRSSSGSRAASSSSGSSARRAGTGR